MPITGNPRIFKKKFTFTVEILGVVHAGFQSCSELSASVAKVQQWEGGTLVADTSPGRITVEEVTLKRGAALGDSDLYQWWLQVANMIANVGLAEPAYEREVDIIERNRAGAVLGGWNLQRTWPTQFVAGEWDNNADENVIQTLKLHVTTFGKAPGSL